MEGILSFFSDLILFTAGVLVAIFWLAIILLIIDEVIDLIITHRNKDNEEETS